MSAYDRLKAWRLQESRAKGRPAFTIFNDSIMEEIARALPGSVEELKLIKGVIIEQ